MLNKIFFKQLKEEFSKSEIERRKIISRSNSILHDAKRSIFSLHRQDTKKAEESIRDIENRLKEMKKEFGFDRLEKEGSYKAAVEEYVEAKMFSLVLLNKKIDKITGLKLRYDSYLGGICDLTGELVRLAVNQASRGELDEVIKTKNMISDIMTELVEMDISGYLRTKYDQARGNLRKIEQIVYDINVRR